MNPVYSNLKRISRQIAACCPLPDFYVDFADDVARSKYFFYSDELIWRLRRFVKPYMQDNLGHGMKHCCKVALDAGALARIESRDAGLGSAYVRHCTRLAHCAGLLHDIRRSQNNHALRGAAFSALVLRYFPFSDADIQWICEAIANHEAFRDQRPIDSSIGRLIAACLYDADKFRWGQDNFKDTLWDMLAVHDPPVAVFISRYPDGMHRLAHIRTTFRSATGRRYGPQFIDQGIAIGNTLYGIIQSQFSNLF